MDRQDSRLCLKCSQPLREAQPSSARYCSRECYWEARRVEQKEAFAGRFWSRVHPTGGCREWSGSKDKNGYGRVGRGGHLVLAHRVAWELSVGSIPTGVVVCHSCDNPSCCDPNHLFLGTYADNTRDMIQKGRRVDSSGSNNPNSKLTECDVRSIRDRASQVSKAELAREFSVSRVCISNIVNRRRWKHVT